MILAEDEVKLYLQASTMAVWAPRGQAFTMRSDPGRAQTGFYGTLNLKSGRVLVTQADTMNARSTVEHLELILEHYPAGPILLLWDRAPWHQGPALRTFLAEHPRLEIVRFPTAAPELNPQEHVWRATRRQVSHNHTQRRLPDLAERFKHHLDKTTFHSSFLDQYGWNIVCPGYT